MKKTPIKNNITKLILTGMIVMLALAVLPVAPAFAANCTSQAVNGNWSVIGSWSCGRVPLAGDDVVIANGNIITLDVVSATVNSLSIADGAANSSLTIAGSNSLIVTTDVNIVNTNNGITKSVDVGAGTLTVNGNLNLSEGNGGTRFAQTTIGTGTVTVAGNITYATNGTATLARIIFSGAGTLNVAGSYPSGTTLTTVAGSKVDFNGAAQTIPGYAFNILSLSGSGTKTLPAGFAANPASLLLSGTASATTAGNFTISGALNVGNGTTLATGANFTLSVGGASTINGTLNLAGTGTKTFTGDVTIGGTGTWNELGTAAINQAGSLTNNGSYNANTGTHTFSGLLKTITPTSLITIPTLILNGTTTITGGILNVATSMVTNAATTNSASGTIIAPTLTTNGGLTNNGAISAGTMTVGTTALTNNATGTINATTSLTIGVGSTNAGSITTPSITINAATTNSGTMNISTTLAGSNTLTNTGALNFGGITLAVTNFTTNGVGSVVNYNGAGAQTVRAVTYDSLILSNSGLKTMSSNSIIVNKILNITGSAIANLTANSGSIYALALGGVGQTGIGTWGSTASGATFKNDVYFASTGLLNTVTHNNSKIAPTLSIDPVADQSFLGGSFTVTGHTTNTDSNVLLYSVVSGPCVLVSGATFNPTGGGTCVIQAYGAATANFEAGYATQSVTINAASQAALTISSTPARVVQGSTGTLSSSGGSGTGLMTYSSGSSTGCNVVGNILNVTDATGSCDVTATKAGDTQYSPITSAPLAIIMTPYQVEINKSFSPANILPGRTSTLSITLYNQNAFDLVNAAWSDNLISIQPGMTIASIPNVTSDCVGGTVTALAGTTSISLSNGTVPAKSGGVNGQCTVTVNITSITAGNLIDTIPAGTVTANRSGGGGGLATNLTPASATLQVTTITPPTVDKNFVNATIYAGAISVLTININNQDPSSSLTNLSLTDNLPPNIQISSTVFAPALTGCGADPLLSLVATPGTSIISISHATIAAGVGIKCTIKVNVTSTVQGSYINMIPGGAIQTAEGVTNAQAAEATLNVQQLNITKGFVPATIPAGGISTATITILNPTSTAYTGINLTDTLPGNMTVSGTPTATQCITGAVTFTSNTVTLTGGSTDPGGSPGSPKTCVLQFQVTVPVTQNSTPLVNTIPAGSLKTDNGISNPSTVTANLNITYALSVSKSFSPTSITVNNPSTVTITITNNSGFPASGVSMTDTLVPAGLVIFGTPPSPQCNGGTVAYNAGPPRTVTLTGGSINAGSNCTVTFQVTSASAATYGNSIAAGGACATLNSTAVCNVIGSGNVNLIVSASAIPVTGSKTFSNPNIAPGGTSVLNINIIAPSDTALHNVSVTDILPAGVTTTNAVSKSGACQNGTVSPGTGLSTISWTSTPGTLSINAGATCTLTVTVTSSTPGFVTNTIPSVQVTDEEGRILLNPISANLNVSNFTISKAFYPPTINQNGLSVLTITLTNQNLIPLTNLTLNDSLPAGVVNAAPSNATTDCGGTPTATSGGGTISLINAEVPAKVGAVNGICTINVTVKGTGAAGVYLNTIRVAPEDVSAYLGPALVYPLAAAPANITIAPLTITVNKYFPDDQLTVFGGSSSTMHIRLSNPNNAILTGISLTDTMPAGMYIAFPANLSTGTCGGSLVGTSGSNTFTYSGGTLPVGPSFCELTLSVTMNVNGNLTNAIPIGAVTTTNGASNTSAAQATLTNLGGASVHKAFSPATIPLGSTSTLTMIIQNTSNFALTNVGGTLVVGGVPNVLDQLPAGLVIASNTSVNNCGGSLTATAGTDIIGLATGNVPAFSSCTITVPVTSVTSACYTNTIPIGALRDDEGVSNGAAGQDTLCILGAPTITTTPNPGSAVVGTRLQDTAGLSGGTSPTGSVTFKLYAQTDPTCSGTPIFTETRAVTPSFTSATTTGFIANTAGTWHWLASYGGDANNSPSSSLCTDEAVTVSKASPSITTVANPVTGTVGINIAAAGDSVTSMSGAFNPTGSITFTLYSDATCNTAVGGMTGNGTILGGVASWSKSWTPVTPGTYYWQASYAGDSNNNSILSACGGANEQIIIAKSTPLLTTTALGPVTLGNSIHDTAHLTGGYGSLGGTISFEVFAPDDPTCLSPIAVTPNRSVNGTGDYTSADFVTTMLGDYHWIAHYSGDASNASVSTTCNETGETSTVGKATPVLTTAASGPVSVGGDITDTAHLTGVYGLLDGTITFSVFAPGDTTCSTALDPQPASAAVIGSGNYTSGAFTTAEVGDYRWQAFYSGDANNNPVSTTCNEAGEISIVNTLANPTLTTTASGPVAVGATITDTAHLSGGSGTLGGTLSFNLYMPGDDTCSNVPVMLAADRAFDGVGDYTSVAYTATEAGTYRWRALYSGDDNNNAINTGCYDVGETSVVDQATPVLTTTASGPVTVGATIRDTAHMSGGYGTLGGTLAFNIYAPGDTTCSSPSAVTPNVTVSGAADYISANFTSLTAGTYRWRAFYSGDVNNSAVSTACNDPSESSLANKATPTLTTTATVSTIVGATITDVAHLGAGYGTLGGTVSFDTFAPGDTTCSSPIVVGSVVPVSGTGNYTSSPYTTTAVGSYRWIAHYSGDTDNIAVSTACNDAGETSAVNKATPILTTTAAGPVTVGQSITDTAHLSGGYGTLGGSLSFSIYAPGDATCSTPTLVTPDVPVSGTGNYASASFTTLATGSYRWRAFYSGDLNNNLVNTPCNDAGETSTVTQAPPTLTTTATASVTVGGTITDTAHLSGGFGTLGGTVSFKVYAPGDIFCFTPIDVSPAVSVNGSNDYTSANFTTLAVGAYRWRAFYSGDTNNIAVSTACNDVGESTTVIKASPTISTTASPSTGTVGTAITAGDSATLSSAFSPTGQVTFTLHSDPSCTIPVVGMSGSGSLAGTSANWSNGWTPVAAGTYFWTAAYPGDANNNSFTTSCGDANEQIVIGKATPTVTTIIHDINDAPVSSIPLGSTVHDSSTVSGVTGITPTGNVIFNFFNNETCTAPSAASSTPFDLVAGSVDASGFTQNPASTGRYSFQANYSGDDKYLAENSACEPLVVVAPPVITKTFFTNMILVNDSVALTFHISNPNDASGGGMTLTGVNFTDSLPAGLVVSTPNGVTGSCGGGTITASSGSTVVSLGGASLIAGGSCTFSVDVTGTTAGLKNNSVTVNSTEGGTGNTSSDSVMVIAPALSIIKSVSSTTKVSAGTWEVTYSLLVENTGNADLTALQVTDDLSATFPLPTTMTFQSVTSPDFTVSPSYNGSSDINLLAGVDTLVTGAHGTITLIVRVVPTESGPFTNVSTASAQPPLGGRISAQSPAVAVTFGPNLFDPPMGIKTVDASGQPVLHWTMVWINDTNLVSVNAVVHDPIPVNTTYSPTLVDSGYPVPGGAPSGSTSIGVSCTTPGSVTVTTLCYYEGPTVANPRGQIIWSGSLGPDFGITDPALATNAIHIGFNVRATTGTTSVQNEATIDSDLNGNGTTTDAGEQQVARASALWNSIPSVLPSTGFPMGEVTALPLPSISYPSLGDLWLEIPNLGLKMPIVGVPQSADGTWDVTWLGNSAGWLNGTAFPTWTGNSVLTGHVWNADNTPGPFSTINKLWYGNQVIIHVSGGKYVYEVREVLQVEPDSVSSMLKHEDRSWITLVTCRGFDATNNTYTYRVLVRAVLVSVK